MPAIAWCHPVTAGVAAVMSVPHCRRRTARIAPAATMADAAATNGHTGSPPSEVFVAADAAGVVVGEAGAVGASVLVAMEVLPVAVEVTR